MSSHPLPYREPLIPGNRRPHPAHLLILLIVSLGSLIWGTILITGHPETDFQTYLLLLGIYGAASAAFVFFQVHRSRLNLFGLPVFITILAFTRFGLAPLYSFSNPQALNPDFLGRYDLLVEALLLVALGMLAFWVGSACFSRARRRDVDLAAGPNYTRTINLNDSVLALAAGLYCAVFVTKLYLLHAHLLSYTMSWSAYHSNLASLQVLGVLASLGSCSLIAFAIESYSRPSDSRRKILFICVFLSECAWGLISGDKHLLLDNFILVAVAASIVQRKIRAGWLLVPFFGLVLFYPLSNSYRSLLRHNGGASSVTTATRLGAEAVSHATREHDGMAGWVDSGWRATLVRLDLLQSAGLIISLGPRAKLLRGRERWWMIPYYQFIPRFIWSSKPVLDEGARFSVALGYGDRTSTAVTYPGDLYAAYGVPGIILGMFLLGIAAQWLTNSISGTFDKRRLFLFAALFPAVTNMEIDSFSFWSSLIKSFVILSAIAFVIYGPRRRTAGLRTARKGPAAQPCES